jgi:hypothetical protein
MKRFAAAASLCAVLLVAANGPAVAHTAQAATPYLQLAGTIPVAGQATVASGDTARAYASGFCGAPGCSPVTLRIGERIAARGVEVSENGTFRTSFTVLEDPGRYTVTASQRAADGSMLEDSATLVVAVGDANELEVPAVTLRVLNARQGLFLASIHPRRCCARKTAFFQRRVAAGHWRTVKRIILNRNAARRFTASLPHGVSTVRMFVPKGARSRAAMSRRVVVRR